MPTTILPAQVYYSLETIMPMAMPPGSTRCEPCRRLVPPRCRPPRCRAARHRAAAVLRIASAPRGRCRFPVP